MYAIEDCGKDITCVMCQYNASVIKINELTIRWGKVKPVGRQINIVYISRVSTPTFVPRMKPWFHFMWSKESYLNIRAYNLLDLLYM